MSRALSFAILRKFATHENIKQFMMFLFERDYILTDKYCNELFLTILQSAFNLHNLTMNCIVRRIFIHTRFAISTELEKTLQLYPLFQEFANTYCEDTQYQLCETVVVSHYKTENTLKFRHSKFNRVFFENFVTEENMKIIMLQWLDMSVGDSKVLFQFVLNFVCNSCSLPNWKNQYVANHSFYWHLCKHAKTPYHNSNMHNALCVFPQYHHHLSLEIRTRLVTVCEDVFANYDVKSVVNRVFADVWIVRNIGGFL